MIKNINIVDINVKKNQGSVIIKANKSTLKLIDFLYKEGFILRYVYFKEKSIFKVIFSSWNNGIILKRVFFFKKNFYVRYKDLSAISIGQFNILVVCTKYGYITHQEALRHKVGGVVKICLVI